VQTLHFSVRRHLQSLRVFKRPAAVLDVGGSETLRQLAARICRRAVSKPISISSLVKISRRTAELMAIYVFFQNGELCQNFRMNFRMVAVSAILNYYVATLDHPRSPPVDRNRIFYHFFKRPPPPPTKYSLEF